MASWSPGLSAAVIVLAALLWWTAILSYAILRGQASPRTRSMRLLFVLLAGDVTALVIIVLLVVTSR